MDPTKRQLYLSVEQSLLEDEPTNGEENDKRIQSRSSRGAFYIFLFTVMVMSLGAILLIHLVSLRISLLHSLNSGFRELEKEVEEQYLHDTEMAEVQRQFEHFEKRHSRQWKSEQERRERMGVFARNLHQIEHLNAEAKQRGRNVTYGVSEMADRTEEEWTQTLCPLYRFKKRRQNVEFIRRDVNPILRKASTAKMSNERETFTAKARNEDNDGEEYPTHFDWRPKGVVTPVKAQGLCGSCWAFAAVAATESAYAVAHGALRNLSEQELLDCNLENNACNGGSADKAFRFIHETGLVTGEEYPYVARRQNVCMLNEHENLTKIDVAVFLNPDEQSMLDWLINFGPVHVSISVPPDMKPYQSGVYWPSDFDCQYRVIGLHSLLVVGYGQTVHGEKYWIVKNSWGQSWGQEHGYLNFIRGINACGMEDEPIGLLA